MTLKIVSGKNVLLKIENLEKANKFSIQKSLFSAGRDLRKYASDDILRKPKSGRTYIRRDKSGRRRRHVASAPGETHANMTGALRRSLGFNVRGSRQLEFGYGVEASNPGPDYASFVDKTRPSIKNAIDASQKNIITTIQNRIIRDLNR